MEFGQGGNTSWSFSFETGSLVETEITFIMYGYKKETEGLCGARKEESGKEIHARGSFIALQGLLLPNHLMLWF